MDGVRIQEELRAKGGEKVLYAVNSALNELSDEEEDHPDESVAA